MATVHVLLTLAGLGVMAVGFLLGRVGDRTRKRHSRLATALPALGGRTMTRGPVELRGTVVPAPDALERAVEPGPDGCFTAPVGGHDDAVLTAWRAVEGPSGTELVGSRRVATGFRSVPFYVDDGGERVLVDPGTLATRDFRFDSELGSPTATVRTGRAIVDVGPFRDEAYVPDRGAAAPALREWVQDSIHLRAGDGFDDRRYEETSLRAGDEVYVLGHARRDTGRAGGSSELLDGGADERFPAADAVVTHPVDGSRMLVSTRGRRALLAESADGTRIYLAGAAVVLGGLALAVTAPRFVPQRACERSARDERRLIPLRRQQMCMSDTRTATFAGGCFWCIEAAMKELDGVHAAESGYTGGHTEDPGYRAVCSGSTGHAEAVQVEYDPETIGYGELLEVFFSIHDPTTVDREGPDVGSQYRSAVYYHDEDQQELVEGFIEALEAEGVYEGIVTEVEPLGEWYRAGEKHQDYFEKNSNQPYCAAQVRPKVEKVREKFTEKVRADGGLPQEESLADRVRRLFR